MATANLHPHRADTSPIVAAYLAAYATDRELDATAPSSESIAVRTAQFTMQGAEHYAMSWSVNDAEHGALVSLLAANRLQDLIDGYCQRDNNERAVVTFGVEELYEVRQIKSAMLNLWRYLDPQGCRRLAPLAGDLGLIDKNGNARI